MLFHKLTGYIKQAAIFLYFCNYSVVFRPIKISSIFVAWILFIIHSIVPHHHVEELSKMAVTSCVHHEYHHTHARTNDDGLPYLNHAEDFASRLIQTDPIVLKLDKHVPIKDFCLPVFALTHSSDKPIFFPTSSFAAASNEVVVLQPSGSPKPGRAPPALC
jgi:hypothetical protein